MVAKCRERPSVSKQKQKILICREFDLKKLNYAEITEQY
jgi:hypothetical protein